MVQILEEHSLDYDTTGISANAGLCAKGMLKKPSHN